ncbi:class I SAM-dependent methyltransferase [Microbacterium terricola]|uniref:SAM-dependent methyltransferase n=1 Tax=Microbacterium terricola TaxID=344163 RepID=A0ABM8DV71_9MICO|nr:class I SAM-dependent methyltransferase [Microbacterium terricola]UYK39679.1 class I SAM-dependent methyltransferase [Microbacterium terricola]BDV29578.1 SAM-dependent methyltransferase [Microbacterium terricola]
MNRDEISRIAHTDHPIAAPVDVSSARRLLARLDPAGSGRVVDLGCGSGAWLLELLDSRPDLTAVGVDTALHPDRDARARRRGVADRLSWIEADAAAWSPADGVPHDAVLCVGASHAFGGLSGTLVAIRRHLRPGGRALLGEMIWEHPQPSRAAQEALDARPEDLPTLSQLLPILEQHGFEAGYAHMSSAQEWDDYEWSWTGSLVAWAEREASNDAEREQALAAARSHRRQWIDGYRGELGFVTVVLHDIRTP